MGASLCQSSVEVEKLSLPELVNNKLQQLEGKKFAYFGPLLQLENY